MAIVLINEKDELFVGWDRVSGQPLRWKPEFRKPEPKFSISVMVYPDDALADEVISELKKHGIVVVKCSLVLRE